MVWYLSESINQKKQKFNKTIINAHYILLLHYNICTSRRYANWKRKWTGNASTLKQLRFPFSTNTRSRVVTFSEEEFDVLKCHARVKSFVCMLLIMNKSLYPKGRTSSFSFPYRTHLRV